MKELAIVLVMTFLLSAEALASSITPPPSLEERVAVADHIFVGTVRTVEVLNHRGEVLTDPPTPLVSGTRVRLTVIPERAWIRTPVKTLPRMVQVTYDIGKFLLSFSGESLHYLNKQMVFLLKGRDYSPVFPLAFAEPIDALPVIESLVEQKPVE